ncbi:hypothetical protein AOA80_10775 [Methanomassiliicoccales archaeon RumEn M1]|nr:hypothetical protein AOA80_10775 [Methanomassiliicoccales archaeon RumEn M1]
MQFVMKDKYRRAVLEDLSNGERGSDAIAKRNRLPAKGVERAVQELRAEELIGGPEDELYITEQGRQVLSDLLEMERGGGQGEAGTGPRKFREQTGDESRKRTENQGN